MEYLEFVINKILFIFKYVFYYFLNDNYKNIFFLYYLLKENIGIYYE